MRLFVTGSTGFVGSHFLNVSAAYGHKIVALRRAGSRPRVPLTHEPHWLEKPMDEVAADDLTGTDILVHLAAHTANVPYDTLERCLHWNLTVPLQLFERARLAGVKRYIVAGSCFEYGRSAERYELVPPSAPLEPVGSYPTSKAAASVAMIGFAQEHNLELAILRIFQVYGEGEAAHRFWPSLRTAALAGRDFPMSPGLQVRDFVNVEEVARQLATALPRPLTAGHPVIGHIGTGRPRTLCDFAAEWWQHWGAQGRILPGAVPYRPNEVMRFVPEIQFP